MADRHKLKRETNYITFDKFIGLRFVGTMATTVATIWRRAATTCESDGSKDNATYFITLRSLKIKLGVNGTKPMPELQNARQRNV
jgi:hypothetical protein